jgi:hypothetical protein
VSKRDPKVEARIERARALPVEAGLLSRSVAWKNGGRGAERCSPCPACGGDDRFSINTAKGVWNCRGARGGRDAISLAMHVAGANFLEAVELLTRGRVDVAETPSTADEAKTSAAHTERQVYRTAGDPLTRERAASLFGQGRDARGSIVERYLASRLLELPEGDALRFHPACPWKDQATGGLIRVPAMLAAMRSIVTDEITAVHRTRLSSDGRKLDRRMFGAAGGAAIKLDSDDAVTSGLVIGEGIETCLAARQIGLTPVWALGSAGAIAGFPVLSGLEGLTILEELDENGANARATQACAARWFDQGREVVLVAPTAGNDLNDALGSAA